MNKFVVFLKREDGKLSVKCYDLSFYDKVGGMASFAANVQGYAKVEDITADNEISAISAALSRYKG